jgi:formate-dependent nitrite reductase membrane component NrfD
VTATISPDAAAATQDGPEDAPRVPRRATEPPSVHGRPNQAGWTGPTYYGRPQLKASPFENPVVGGYIFLAGLSGSASAIAALADIRQGSAAAPLVRRGRYLALLAPVLGAPLLIYDLHTPKRFYNMLRVAKHTSPMSIGTWILMGFTGAAGLTAAAQLGTDLWPRARGLNGLARAAQVPAALTGLGLSTYTASLLSATSTPLWAAAPRSLAMRFGASSMASAATALSVTEPDPGRRRALEGTAAAALAVELAGAAISHATYQRTGVAGALKSRAGRVEHLGATLLGTALPLGVFAASLLTRRGLPRPVTALAAAATLAGAAALRVSIMAAGDRSAEDPNVSFRFSQPENLPER